jgi:hypothetical protein
MAAALPPPEVQARIVCSIQEAQRYGVPPAVMLAVAQIEGGRPGLAVRNTNGTYDLGPMQLNTAWLATLRPYGVDPRWALASGCYPYQLAAWRIRGHLLGDRGDYWTRVANYHSRTPSQNRPYRVQVITIAMRWDSWLQRVQAAQVQLARAQEGAR